MKKQSFVRQSLGNGFHTYVHMCSWITLEHRPTYQILYHISSKCTDVSDKGSRFEGRGGKWVGVGEDDLLLSGERYLHKGLFCTAKKFPSLSLPPYLFPILLPPLPLYLSLPVPPSLSLSLSLSSTSISLPPFKKIFW
jgi:hypothetical protein